MGRIWCRRRPWVRELHNTDTAKQKAKIEFYSLASRFWGIHVYIYKKQDLFALEYFGQIFYVPDGLSEAVVLVADRLLLEAVVVNAATF